MVRKPRFKYERQPTPQPERRNYDGRKENNMEELDALNIEDEHAVVTVEETQDLPQCPSIPVPPAGIDVFTVN